jgi:anti-sigma factor RsiW
MARKRNLLRWLKGLMLRRMHRMITCEEFEGFILAYLDDELPQRQRTIFELHIRLCRECRDYLAAYRRTTELSRAVMLSPSDRVADDVPQDLIEAVLKSLK